MNRMVENYLRCYCNYHQNNWDELLPAAEFAYNSAVGEDMGMSPFEIDLGWNPKSPLDLLAGPEDKNETVEEFKVKLLSMLVIQFHIMSNLMILANLYDQDLNQFQHQKEKNTLLKRC